VAIPATNVCSGLSVGVEVAIGVTCGVAVVASIVCVVWILHRRRKRAIMMSQLAQGLKGASDQSVGVAQQHDDGGEVPM
jgi:hypothetical protein